MFERASTIIRDGSKLDFDYVPGNLVHRESQMARLETLFRPLAERGRPCTAFLTGSVGTGKTVTAARFRADLTEYMAKAGRPMDSVYINCRNTSEAGVLLSIVRLYDRGYPDRGFSADEMARAMVSHLSSSPRGLLVILDEVDVLLKRGTVDVVYQLTRTDVPRTSPVSIILISQYAIDGLLDEASMSTFRRANTIKFNRYSQSELREIVAARAEEALHPGRITEDALDLIAEHAADYGDARLAIELLDRAANIAEEDSQGEVTVEHVRAAKAMIYSSVSESKLMSLNINKMAVVLATARAIKDSPAVPAAHVEKTYAVVCEEYGLKARKHTQFWSYLQDLDRMGIVKLSQVTDLSGRSVNVALPDIPSKVLAAKMESIIEGMLEEEGDEVRSLRPRGGDLRQVQRHPPLRPPLHAVRGQEGEAGDPQADRREPRRQDRGGGVRGEGQHGRPQDGVVGVRPQERGGGPRHHNRRGDRGLPPSQR